MGPGPHGRRLHKGQAQSEPHVFGAGRQLPARPYLLGGYVLGWPKYHSWPTPKKEKGCNRPGRSALAQFPRSPLGRKRFGRRPPAPIPRWRLRRRSSGRPQLIPNSRPSGQPRRPRGWTVRPRPWSTSPRWRSGAGDKNSRPSAPCPEVSRRWSGQPASTTSPGPRGLQNATQIQLIRTKTTTVNQPHTPPRAGESRPTTPLPPFPPWRRRAFRAGTPSALPPRPSSYPLRRWNSNREALESFRLRPGQGPARPAPEGHPAGQAPTSPAHPARQESCFPFLRPRADGLRRSRRLGPLGFSLRPSRSLTRSAADLPTPWCAGLTPARLVDCATTCPALARPSS